jgi:hypothetical protein
MKILKIFIILLSITLIFTKLNSKKANISKNNKKEHQIHSIIENISDVPFNGVAVTNDHLLQNAAV